MTVMSERRGRYRREEQSCSGVEEMVDVMVEIWNVFLSLNELLKNNNTNDDDDEKAKKHSIFIFSTTYS